VAEASGAAWAAFLRELYGLAPRGIQPGLERMRAALSRLGDPQRSFDVVHIAGTNGKGSVAAMVAAGISDPGVGRFTSPHLHCLTERFVVGGEPVSRDALIALWADVKARIADVPLTFFETITVLAFVLFERRRVRIAVLETGLGGRLDSTNVSERKLVTCITRVALDHQAWLGDDLVGIAAEKAGILAAEVPCVLAPQVPAVDAEISRIADGLGVSISRPRVAGPSSALNVSEGSRASGPLRLRLAGQHQRDNAGVAVAVLWALERRGVPIDLSAALLAGWPGRLEGLGAEPRVLLDIAHNPNAADALAAHLQEQAFERRVLVFGAMRDKDWARMLATLRPLFDQVILTRAPMSRAEEPARMAAAGERVEPRVTVALAAATEWAGPAGLVVVAGSAFVVAEARAHLLGVETDPPIAF